MWHRIRQLLHAFTANMAAEDRQFVAQYLSLKEQQSFYAMDVNSQKHCVLVARTCLQLLSPQADSTLAFSPDKVNSKQLLRAALLHDIGKIKGDLNTWERVMVVVIKQFCPKLAIRLSSDSHNGETTGLSHAIYVHHHHSRLGQEKAITLGVEDEVCSLIANHHCAPYSGEPLELTILRRSDDIH